MIIVSSCLAGINCRYDGCSKPSEDVIALIKSGKAIPICPEQMGGLPTPRIPAEIIQEKVINKSGNDVTSEYNLGVKEAISVVKMVGATEAILKSKSPMCGVDQIYDGTFTGNLTSGDGLFVRELKKLKIKIKSS